jgi:hypothetical protein
MSVWPRRGSPTRRFSTLSEAVWSARRIRGWGRSRDQTVEERILDRAREHGRGSGIVGPTQASPGERTTSERFEARQVEVEEEVSRDRADPRIAANADKARGESRDGESEA